MITINVLQGNMTRNKRSPHNLPCIRVSIERSPYTPIVCHRVEIAGPSELIQSEAPHGTSVNLKVPDGVVVTTYLTQKSGQVIVKKVRSPDWDAL